MTTNAFRPPCKADLFWIFSAAILLRLLVFGLGPMHAPARAVVGDSKGYITLSQNLARYGRFGNRSAELGIARSAAMELRRGNGTLSAVDEFGLRPEMLRTPGYPALIALIARGTDEIRPVLLLQALLGSLTALGIVLVGSAWGFTRSSTLVCGYLWACHPALILLDNLILTESTFNFVIVSAMVAAAKGTSLLSVGVAGGLVGVASLIRPPFGLLFLPTILAMVWRDHRARRVRVILVVALVFTVPAMWATRNWALGEGFILSTVSRHNAVFYAATCAVSQDLGQECNSNRLQRTREVQQRLGQQLTR